MIKVFINPGHGGKDPGAVGFGLTEKDVVLAVALKTCKILEGRGINVVMNRKTDTFDELDAIVRKANAAKADLFVSIHANAAGVESAHGVETFSCRGSSQGATLAKAIHDAIIADKSLYTANRGLKTAGFYVIKYTAMPAALVELAFITNRADNNLLRTKQDAYAEAIAKGIMTYIGVEPEKKEEKEETHVKDYAGHWAEKDIDEAIKHGWMIGDEKGNFRPNDTITRAEMAVILNRLKK